MNRREAITLIGSAAARPLAARAQQPERMRRIGVLMSTAADHSESKARLAAFLQRLQVTRTVPIVFVAIADPVGGGFVENLARPGGNATGFTVFEYAIGAKWLELLKEIAPGLTRAAVLRDSQQISGGGQFGAIQAVAPSFGVELSPIDLRDAGEIERSLGAFARNPNGGLIVTAGGLTLVHRELIITLAARHSLPAVYWNRFYVTGGGLMSYGPDPIDQYRQAAGYVDRILKGEKPADLPVQAPTKYELVINLKTVKALGLTVPPTDQAIEQHVHVPVGVLCILLRDPEARDGRGDYSRLSCGVWETQLGPVAGRTYSAIKSRG